MTEELQRGAVVTGLIELTPVETICAKGLSTDAVLLVCKSQGSCQPHKTAMYVT